MRLRLLLGARGGFGAPDDIMARLVQHRVALAGGIEPGQVRVPAE